MIGKLLYEVVPFNNFREKVRLLKQYEIYKCIVLDNCIMIGGLKNVKY